MNKDFSSDDNYQRLRDDYNQRYLEQFEADHNKIDMFYEKVLPSMASPLDDGTYACLFDSCANKQFANKQSYFRHLQTVHRNDMPGGGSFLTPNSVYFGAQYCAYCNARFSRKDKLADHLRNNKKCARLRVASENRNDEESNVEVIIQETTTTRRSQIISLENEDTQDELARLTQNSIKLNDDASSQEEEEDFVSESN